MGTVKTAVSLDRELLDEAEALASKLNISRSQLISRALEEYLRGEDNREFQRMSLDELNRRIAAAYPDGLTDEDQVFLHGVRRHMRENLAADPWQTDVGPAG